MKKLFFLGIVLLPFCSTAIAEESPVLTPDGIALGRHSAASVTDGLSIRVDLNGDTVTATYVTARFQNNTPRQRLVSGYWQPWDERVETLQDNTFSATEDGFITFEVLDESVSNQFLPIVFTISYRTEDGIKSGYVVIDQ